MCKTFWLARVVVPAFNCVLGIDPGLKGCCCILQNDGVIDFFDHEDCNIVEVIKDVYFKYKPDFCLVEEQQTRPFQSARATKTTFVNYGRIIGCLETLGIAFQIVSPNKWQKIIPGLVSSKEGVKHKRQIAEYIGRLYPQADMYTERGRLIDGRSDALTIAHYGMKHV